MSPRMRALIEESKGYIREYEKNMPFQDKVLQEQFAFVRGSLSDDQLAIMLVMMRIRQK